MTNLIKWGNGAITLGSIEREKDFLSGTFAQQSAGVRVQWSPTDIETLTGTTWQLSTINVPLWVQTRYVSMFNYSGTRFTFSATGSNAKTIYPTTSPVKNRILITYDGSSNPWKIEHFVWGWATSAKTGNPSWIFSSLSSSVQNAFRTPCAFNSAGSPFGVLSSPGCSGAGVASGNYLDLVGNQFVSASSTTTFPIKRVTTNSEATSERQTNIDPIISLLSGDCTLAITYTDNSTEQVLITGACPTWVDCECIYPGACTILDRMINQYGV